MSYGYEDIYTGDLSKIAEQFKRVTWAGTTKATKEWPKGIPGQASVVALIADGVPFKEKGTGFLARCADRIKEHGRLLAKRGQPLAAENMPPTGQAYLWYRDVIQYVPLSGMLAAKQIARLCGDDSQVTIPWRSLADAVGRKNRAGNLRSYTERGVQALVESGWLTVKTIGSKRGAKTTFYLQVGDFTDRTWMRDEDLYDEEVTV
ncbi:MULTISPECIES: hypothetical protein [Streptomyces]|uniref:hypothetical protein n=1 Tax=Streptomyces TaxID=1883 RepID=UPI001F198257|nr:MULTISPECIES: hypothetical protein [Streptomyces]MDX2758180.1 hypothetical protein [Streptomyces europaeiscabiei]MDX3831985.1 hypothetical protein [Streptomyces europaeiscabiei]UJV43413.1 hypothetical protein CVT30_29430 [Streptomyces sp. AMCC400023]UUU23318.1 hypothetical protein JIX55_25260 [Streptomyces sp. DSM 40750]WSG25157.1 hypothetical protein OHB30_31705 [Streptomyces europaeiscabiei]